MELLVLIAVCVVIYKIIDSNKSEKTVETTIHSTIDKHGKVESQSVSQRTVETVTSTDITGSRIQPAENSPRVQLVIPNNSKPETSTTPLSHHPQSIPDYTQSPCRTVNPNGRKNLATSSDKTSTGPLADLAQTQPDIGYPTTASSPQSETKACPRCGTVKDKATEFYKTAKYSDGVSKWCSDCIDRSKSTKKKKASPGTKFCTGCKKNRRPSSFFNSSKNADGLSKWCIDCLNKQKKKQYKQSQAK